MGPFTYLPQVRGVIEPLTIQAVDTTRPVLTGPVASTILAGPSLTVQGVDFQMPSAAEGLAMDLTEPP
jgi:hypothetical protein